MLSRADIIDTFVHALTLGLQYQEPYPLLEFCPFSPPLYKMIVDNLPSTDKYIELRHPDAIRPDGSCSRLVFPLKHDRIYTHLTGYARAFWIEFSDILRDIRLLDAFKTIFDAELRRRFGGCISTVPMHRVPMLIRDFGGYRIRIHHDIDTKVITTQYYLAKDSSQRHLGTSVYARSCAGECTVARRIEFLPRTAYAFAVSRHSWHAVSQMAETEQARNSLMLIYYRLAGIDY